MQIDVGSLEELQSRGFLTGKAGAQPVCVFWHEGCAFALDDRCPHLGFPLHRGTVESGLVTCHWHHARFDLASGGTLDPFADDARSYPVEVDGGRVLVSVEGASRSPEYLLRRLNEGLEEGITLVIAKSVLGLLEAGGADRVAQILDAGAAFGCTYKESGFGSGLTVLTAMANVLPMLDQGDRAVALVHGLMFVSDDTLGNRPRFALAPLEDSQAPVERLAEWYRRFVETRSGDAAERTLATLIAAKAPLDDVERAMTTAATDHAYLDEGHTLDFNNKAFELLGHLGPEQAGTVLPTLVHQTVAATRHEETSSWRHPYDIAGIVRDLSMRRPSIDGAGAGHTAVRQLADRVIAAEDPSAVVAALDEALAAGATVEELARGVALAASLRIVRFHTSSDHGDWNVVHHGFTHANAVHQACVRAPSPELVRGVYHAGLKVFLDRFLNVPAARIPAEGEREELAGLVECFEKEGCVDEAGGIVYRFLRGGGSLAEVVAALGHALVAEDAGFHWYQTYEAAVRQAHAWPEGSQEVALVMTGAARFLAAHTPTRRELAQVVRIATRLRRGEALYEEDEPEDPQAQGVIR